MDENGICDQHGRSLDHPWGCFCCGLAEVLARDESTHEPEWKPIVPVCTCARPHPDVRVRRMCAPDFVLGDR